MQVSKNKVDVVVSFKHSLSFNLVDFCFTGNDNFLELLGGSMCLRLPIRAPDPPYLFYLYSRDIETNLWYINEVNEKDRSGDNRGILGILGLDDVIKEETHTLFIYNILYCGDGKVIGNTVKFQLLTSQFEYDRIGETNFPFGTYLFDDNFRYVNMDDRRTFLLNESSGPPLPGGGGTQTGEIVIISPPYFNLTIKKNCD